MGYIINMLLACLGIVMLLFMVLVMIFGFWQAYVDLKERTKKLREDRSNEQQ